MPTDIIIYAIVAAVMVFWLRNVIGTRHGEERERPNPFEKVDDPKITDKQTVKKSIIDKMSKYSEGGENLDAGLVQIALTDKNFDANDFKENASDAFTYIVTAFAVGDVDTLNDLCTDEVYKTFAADIAARKKRKETIENQIHAVRKIDITNVIVRQKRHADITIRFTADETYVIRDAKGEITAGHPDRVTEMVDKWTFTRDLKSTDPRWLLSKVEDDVIEADGKTPIPDAG